MEQRVEFNTELIKRYDVAGPRYTSYPTAVQFNDGFDAEAYRRHTAASNSELIPKPLSLYVHLPFCKSLCYYCGCNKIVTRNEERVAKYMRNLYREIELQSVGSHLQQAYQVIEKEVDRFLHGLRRIQPVLGPLLRILDARGPGLVPLLPRAEQRLLQG